MKELEDELLSDNNDKQLSSIDDEISNDEDKLPLLNTRSKKYKTKNFSIKPFWGPMQTLAFNKIQDKLRNIKFLSYPNNDMFVVTSDSSYYAMGGALYQWQIPRDEETMEKYKNAPTFDQFRNTNNIGNSEWFNGINNNFRLFLIEYVSKQIDRFWWITILH